MLDTTAINKAMTVGERFRNNVVVVVTTIAAVAGVAVDALNLIDFASPGTVYVTLMAAAAALSKTRVYGPLTVERLRDSGDV